MATRHRPYTNLHDLGPIGRHTHRHQRRQLEDRIDNFTDEIDSSNQQVADAEQRLSTIEPTVLTRERWEAHHGTELARLDTLNRQIEVTERLDRVGNRTPERGVDRDFDIGM